jgi:nicotinamidase-related amidase
MAIWDDIIIGEDKQVHEKVRFGRGVEFGRKPALVIIDVVYSFVGDKPEPILKSVERFRLSCGDKGWRAVNQIAPLLALAREKKVPVVYAKPGGGNSSQRWPWHRSPEVNEMAEVEYSREVVREITPTVEDIVIEKATPSVFMGTPLVNILVARGIDTLFVCGCTTSGCVRASVVDAAAYGFRVGVIEECTFDRFEISHKVSLFDMNAKYARVVSVAEIKDYLSLKNQKGT